MRDKSTLMLFIDKLIPEDFEWSHCSLTFNDDCSAELLITCEVDEDGEESECN